MPTFTVAGVTYVEPSAAELTEFRRRFRETFFIRETAPVLYLQALAQLLDADVFEFGEASRLARHPTGPHLVPRVRKTTGGYQVLEGAPVLSYAIARQLRAVPVLLGIGD